MSDPSRTRIAGRLTALLWDRRHPLDEAVVGLTRNAAKRNKSTAASRGMTKRNGQFKSEQVLQR
jgi:hypothetical protein